MRTEKLSVNKVCMVVCAALFLLSIAMSCTIYFLTRNVLALCCGLLYAVCVAGCMTAFLAFVRRKLTLFSDALCKLLDDMMSADQAPPQYTEEENLFYKIQHRLSRLYEVLRESKSSIAKERADLQELISDISHQVKIPSGQNADCKPENAGCHFVGAKCIAGKAERISSGYGQPVRQAGFSHAGND